MNFICTPCKSAASIIARGVPALIDFKRKGHKNCKGGTWCDCQHRVGSKNAR